MTLTGAEGAVRAVKAGLQAAMPAKLAELEARYGDAIALTPPKAYLLGRKSLFSLPEYPVVIILAERGRDAWSGGVVAENVSTEDLVIGMILYDQDPEVLQLKVYRYCLALLEVVIQGTALGLFAGWAVGAADDSPTREYGPVYAPADSVFLVDTRLRISAVKPEVM